jgi:hypothetical protein
MFRSSVVASTTKLAVKLRALTNSRPNVADPSQLKSGGWKGKFMNLRENRFLINVCASPRHFTVLFLVSVNYPVGTEHIIIITTAIVATTPSINPACGNVIPRWCGKFTP